MKLTQIEFTLMLATLVVLCGASYDAGQRSRPPILLINPTPAPVAAPTPEPPGYWEKPLFLLEPQGDPTPAPKVKDGRVYMLSGGRGQYYHLNRDCWYWNGKKAVNKILPCPRCAGGQPEILERGNR